MTGSSPLQKIWQAAGPDGRVPVSAAVLCALAGAAAAGPGVELGQLVDDLLAAADGGTAAGG